VPGTTALIHANQGTAKATFSGEEATFTLTVRPIPTTLVQAAAETTLTGFNEDDPLTLDAWQGTVSWSDGPDTTIDKTSPGVSLDPEVMDDTGSVTATVKYTDPASGVTVDCSTTITFTTT